MNTYVALLRGINVGGNNKVEMVRLKTLFQTMGFSDVATYINSGNVIFRSPKKNTKGLSGSIEKELKKIFGFEIRAIIKDSDVIKKICKITPAEWTNNADQKTDVMFLWEKFNNKKTVLMISHNPTVDNLKYIDGAIIWNIKRAHYPKSGMHKFIGTEVYKNMTARNINTVRKLKELMRI